MDISWGSFTGGALLGILIGHLLNHVLAKERAKLGRNAAIHNQAVADFKSAFTDALVNFHYRENTVALILKQTFDAHKIAYICFREKLPPSKKDKFAQVWVKYEEYYNQNAKGQIYTLFASAKTDYETQHRMFIIGLIKELMVFAKEV